MNAIIWLFKDIAMWAINWLNVLWLEAEWFIG